MNTASMITGGASGVTSRIVQAGPQRNFAMLGQSPVAAPFTSGREKSWRGRARQVGAWRQCTQFISSTRDQEATTREHFNSWRSAYFVELRNAEERAGAEH